MAEPAKKLEPPAPSNVAPLVREAEPGTSLTGSLISSRDDYFVRQAYRTLHVAFTMLPIMAGIDKYFRVLANWDDYVAPIVVQLTGLAPRTIMSAVGVIEIIAGIGVAFKPRLFGLVVSLWLGAIVVNLLLTGTFFDIAARDAALALAAFALARLSPLFDRQGIE